MIRIKTQGINQVDYTMVLVDTGRECDVPAQARPLSQRRARGISLDAVDQHLRAVDVWPSM
jgi:hypothetical protein